MRMKTLCVGNTWEEEFLDGIIAMNSTTKTDVRVRELFGSEPSLAPSVRTADRLPSHTPGHLRSFISRARENNIEVHWTLNQMLNEPLQSFKKTWEEKLKPAVHEIVELGIRQFSIANPLLLNLIREELGPDFYLEASTIASVDSVKKLEEWAMLGATGVCPALDLNRDLDGLRSLVRAGKRFNVRIKVLANEACLQGCPHRHTTCYLSQSLESERSEDLFGGYPFWCNDRRAEDPSQWLKAPVIIPQWLDYYESITGVTSFKITGRTFPSATVLSIVEKYMAKNWDGNFMELIPGYSHLIGRAAPQVEIDNGAWNIAGQPFLRDPRFRCLDHCGVTCSFCDLTFEKIGKDNSRAEVLPPGVSMIDTSRLTDTQ